MIKRIMISIMVIAALTLTGCTENREKLVEDNSASVSAEGGKPTNSTSEVENETSINTSEPVESTTSSTESKPEEKLVESTSSTVEKPVSSSTATSSKPVSSSTSTTTSKPVSSSTTSKPSTPVSSSSTTTTVSTSKPVEKPVHNCSTDGHVWEVTTTTTEPKWCREMHDVTDFGFDCDLASKYLGVDAGEVYQIFKKTCKENGVNGASGSATIEVEVWGTETYKTKICKICGSGEGSDKGTINPIGEWQFKDGINRRLQAVGCDFNTLFYDPYNVPQVVIDNIRIYRNR